MICQVDASLKNNKSSHSFVIKNKDGKILYKKAFKGFETRSTEAELNSIIKALQFINKKNLRKVTIITDCLSIVEAVNKDKSEKIDVSYLKFLLKSTRTNITWIPREYNVYSDSLCRNINKPKIKKGLLIK